jgi:hypothetical protein
MRGTSKAAIAALAVGLVSVSARAEDAVELSRNAAPNPADPLTNDAECTPIRAAIVTNFFVDGCESIFGICTEGAISSGPLAGTTRFAVTALDVVSSPDYVGYTGVLVITTAQGTVTIRDKGALSNVNGTFFELDWIVGGTDLFGDAKGILFSAGISTPTGFDGWIYGQVCHHRAEVPPTN